MASFHLKNGLGNQYFCGVSILDCKTLHCFATFDNWGTFIRAGSKDAWNGGQLIQVEKSIEYPKKMDPNTNEHDIYILLKILLIAKNVDLVFPILESGNAHPERYLKWDSEPIASKQHCEGVFGIWIHQSSQLDLLWRRQSQWRNLSGRLRWSFGLLGRKHTSLGWSFGRSAKTRAHLCGLVSRTILLGSRPTWKNKLPSINSSRASSEIKASFTKITECKGLFSFVS